MKRLFITALLVASSSMAFAISPPANANNDGPRMSSDDRRSMREEMHNFNQDHPMSKEHFEKFKEKALEHHLKHLDMIQASISCIKAATTPDALRGCREKEKEQMEQMREQRKEFMEKRREEKSDNPKGEFGRDKNAPRMSDQRPMR